MERTEINYRKLADGRIHVTGIKNSASSGTIKEAFGREVAATYFNGRPRYSGGEVTDETGQYMTIFANEIYTADHFNRLISTMKAAGKRLNEIVEFTKASEIKTILI